MSKNSVTIERIIVRKIHRDTDRWFDHISSMSEEHKSLLVAAAIIMSIPFILED